MGKKVFHTLIKGLDKRWGNNEYVLGVINGMMSVMCGEDNCRYAHGYNEKTKDNILTTECSRRRYRAFAKAVEKRYPGLCEFDVCIE